MNHYARAGQMRVPVQIEQHDGTKNNRGQLDLADANWDHVALAWASVETLRGGEVERASKMFSDATHVVRIRYEAVPSLTSEMRIKRRDTNAVLHIGFVSNIGQRGAVWEILAAEATTGSG